MKDSLLAEQIIERLKSDDSKERDAAVNELKDAEISKELGIFLISHANEEYPEDDEKDIPFLLIRLCADNPYPEYINALDANYNSYGQGAKSATLHLLAQYDNEKAAKTYMRLLKADIDQFEFIPHGDFPDNPHHADIFFPELLEYTDNIYLLPDICRMLLACIENGLLDENVFSGYEEQLEAAVLEIANLSSDIDPEDEETKDFLNNAGLIFDVAGFCSDAAMIASLVPALNPNNKYVALFAVKSILQLGGNIEGEVLLDIAADDECRNVLYDQLEKIGKSKLFPKKYLNQSDFARSDMVRWLMYPTELGQKPDEIELMQTFTIGEDGDGEELYLFRFRTDDGSFAESGYMAGLAGGYQKSEQPTTRNTGFTFSCFEDWNSKSPKEHAVRIYNLLCDTWKRRAEEQNDED